MNRPNKTRALIASSLLLLVCLSTTQASAQKTVTNGDIGSHVVDSVPLEQGQLDQVLAPIALYPDSLLSQLLVAATYPLEVVQATRWRQANQSLSEKQVIDAIEDKQWDPSVKALTPFTDLIVRLSKDLDWLQQLGDAFLQNEEQVLASIQTLRQKARDNGSIADNDYYDVVEDDDNIIIKSTNREIVYAPYYDSRVVYGAWGWNDYQPVYWHRPSHYRLHAGFYWSDRFYIRPTIFFGGFHWRSRNLVVNHHFYDRPYRQNNRYRNVRVSDYRHWNHNPAHRRGVRYSRNRGDHSAYRNQFNSRARTNRQTHERRHEGNRVVSNNPRNRDNIRITERSRVERSRVESNRTQARPPQPRRHEPRVRRTDRDNLAARQQSVNRPERTVSNPRRNNNSANTRNAPVTYSPSKRTTVTRQDNSSKGNDKADSRASVRKEANPKRRSQVSNKRSHKKPN
ncbi:MAG: hypothetical protein ACJAQ6_000499 [Arenicella sp.]|jgi:hypothetical protein